jgi:ferredoxin like protein
MSEQTMNLDARLGLDRYNIDEQNNHIAIDQSRCRVCEDKPCLTVCPAEVYRLGDDEVTARYENCIECGTCQITCDDLGKGGIDWQPPVGGYGILYRYG